jgi:hypothetical protein
MSDHIADVGKMVGARDVLARARCERHWRTPCDMSGCAEFGCEWRKGAEADLAALSAAGWVVVPVEPTPHMVNRGLVRADIDWRAASEDEALSDDEARRIYRAMIAAAPITASQEASDDAK